MWFQEWWNSILVFTKVWVVTEREYASMPKLFHLDDYDHCMLYGKDALYCSISLQLRPSNYNNVSDVWKVIETVSSAKRYYKHDLLRHGVCVTERCPDIDKSGLLKYNSEEVELLNDCYGASFQNMGLAGEIVQIHCENNESLYSPNKYDFLFASFIFLVVTLVLFASFYDIILKVNFEDPTSKSTLFGKYISSFSVSQNWKRLTHTTVTHPIAKALSSLQSVRLLCVTLVVLSHTSTINMAVPVANPRFMEHFVDRPMEHFLGLPGRINVMQLFFLMSTLLVALSFYAECHGKEDVPFSYIFKRLFNRYLRLTPLMAFVILFEATWIPYFSKGPLWDSVIGMEYKLCRKNWWTNLLYINNFWAFNELCASHLWSLGVDMQFYVTTLLILWLVWRYPKTAPWILGSIWLLHLFLSFYRIGSRKDQYVVSPESTYNITLVNVADHITILNDNMLNIPGFLAGIIYAYLFYRYRDQNLFTKKIHVIMMWIFSWGVIIATIITPGIIIHFLDKNLLLLFLYLCFSRTAFAAACGLFILGMTQGQGGFLKRIFEWPPFYVLGRLTYGVYLIHPLVQRYKIAVIRAPNYLSDFNFIFEYVAFFACSFLLAIPLILFFEMPFEQFKRHVMVKPEIKIATNSEKND